MQTMSFNVVKSSSILQHAGGYDIEERERNWVGAPSSTTRLPTVTTTTIHHRSNFDGSNHLPDARESITGRLAVFLQNPIIGSNQHEEDVTNTNLYFENITQLFKNHQDVPTTKPPKKDGFSRNTQILEISTPKLKPVDDLPEDTKLMFPTKETLEFFGFTSGHQNNFGIPIEEDERILRMLNEQIIKIEKTHNHSADYYPTTTDGSAYRTRVSPTLPILHTIDTTTERLKSNHTQDDGIRDLCHLIGIRFKLFIDFLIYAQKYVSLHRCQCVVVYCRMI